MAIGNSRVTVCLSPLTYSHLSAIGSINVRRPNVLIISKIVRKWNQLNKSIRNCSTISGFKLQLVGLVRPTKKSTFGVHDTEGVRLLNAFASLIQ